MADREKIVEIFSELRNFADKYVYPVASPENWHVYSKLRDLIDQAEEDALALLKNLEPVAPHIVKDGYMKGRDRAYCGACGMGIRIGGYPQKNTRARGRDYYCGYCGKEVKWE